MSLGVEERCRELELAILALAEVVRFLGCARGCAPALAVLSEIDKMEHTYLDGEALLKALEGLR